MKYGRALVVGGSIAFIATALIISYSAEVAFNPYPVTTTLTMSSTCASPAGCPGFEMDGANLSVNLFQDVRSQELTVRFTPLGGVPLGRVAIFLDNVSVGTIEGPFPAGVASTAGAGIPTIISLTPGTVHQVAVEGVYLDAAGNVTGTYWRLVSVLAG